MQLRFDANQVALSVSSNVMAICEQDGMAGGNVCPDVQSTFASGIPGLPSDVTVAYQGLAGLIGNGGQSSAFPGDGNCPDMVICGGPGGEYGFREISIHSGSMSRDSKIEFELPLSLASNMAADSIQSVTVLRARFEVGGTGSSAYRDLLLSVGPDAKDPTVLSIVATRYESLSNTFHVIRSARAVGTWVQIDLESTPNGTHSVGVIVRGFFGPDVLVVDNADWPTLLGTTPKSLSYGNIGVNAIGLSELQTVAMFPDWIVSVGELFHRCINCRY